MKLSTLTICTNEDEFIEQCIKYCQTIADEIIIVDGGSTDDTLKIIEKMMKSSKRIKLFKNKMGESFADQRNFAKSKCTGHWILQVDADEKFEPGLKVGISALIARTRIIGYSFPTYHLWKDEKHYVNADADPHIRLFQNIPEVKYVGDVHETLTFRTHALIPHPSHFNKFTERYVRYIGSVRLLHYTFLRSKESVRKKVKNWKKFYQKSADAGVPVTDEFFKKPKPKKVFKIGDEV